MNPMLRAQFYHDEAKKLRGLAGAEDKERGRETLLQLADSYDQLSEQIFLRLAQITNHTGASPAH